MFLKKLKFQIIAVLILFIIGSLVAFTPKSSSIKKCSVVICNDDTGSYKLVSADGYSSLADGWRVLRTVNSSEWVAVLRKHKGYGKYYFFSLVSDESEQHVRERADDHYSNYVVMTVYKGNCY